MLQQAADVFMFTSLYIHVCIYMGAQWHTPELLRHARHNFSSLCKQQQATGVVVQPVKHIRLGLLLLLLLLLRDAMFL